MHRLEGVPAYLVRSITLHTAAQARRLGFVLAHDYDAALRFTNLQNTADFPNQLAQHTASFLADIAASRYAAHF